MPNYCYNTVKMPGITDLPIYTVNEEGGTDLDFNKIIPMPECLRMESGTVTDNAVLYYLTDGLKTAPSKLPKKKYDMLFAILDKGLSDAFPSLRPPNWLDNDYQRLLEKDMSDEDRESMMTLGGQYVSNYETYGAATWYEWAYENWGTKWNAMDLEVDSNDGISFDTAWAPPVPVLARISEKYHRPLLLLWTEEGGTAGVMLFSDGKIEAEIDFDYADMDKAYKILLDASYMTADELASLKQTDLDQISEMQSLSQVLRSVKAAYLKMCHEFRSVKQIAAMA